MIQVNQLQAMDANDYHNELLPNGEYRYRQLIQVGLPPDARHPDGRVIEVDYDLQEQQAILVDQVDDQRIYYRVAREVRAKEIVRNFYGFRRFRLENIWRRVERRPGDPKLMDLTFPEMLRRYDLLQFEIVRLEPPVLV
jgi:hypothetical protein